MSSLLADMDKLLSANNRFLLGHWLADAKSWATDNAESKLLEYNARNQITLWGPDGEVGLCERKNNNSNLETLKNW